MSVRITGPARHANLHPARVSCDTCPASYVCSANPTGTLTYGRERGWQAIDGRDVCLSCYSAGCATRGLALPPLGSRLRSGDWVGTVEDWMDGEPITVGMKWDRDAQGLRRGPPYYVAVCMLCPVTT